MQAGAITIDVSAAVALGAVGDTVEATARHDRGRDADQTLTRRMGALHLRDRLAALGRFHRLHLARTPLRLPGWCCTTIGVGLQPGRGLRVSVAADHTDVAALLEVRVLDLIEALDAEQPQLTHQILDGEQFAAQVVMENATVAHQQQP